MDNSIYNCAEYRRLSKEDKLTKDESSSITNQGLIINAFAKHNGFRIVKTYIDDGYSGSNFDRPDFKQMIEDIESGKINCVITKDLSRIGREMYETGKYIEEYFREKRVRYIAINDSYDSIVGDSMLGVRLSVNDLYLRDVSKKVRTSFRAKQEKGDYIGSFPKYGFKKDPQNHNHLIIDEEAAEIVRLIYSWYIEGLGISKICHNLTDSKVPIPIVHKKDPRAKHVTENDGNGIWKKATVRDILKSEMYIGNMVQHCYEKVSYNQKKLISIDKKNQIIVKNTHEAIISKEDFEKAQKRINSESKDMIPKNYDRFLLSGLLYCGKCGHTLGISERQIKSGVSRFTSCNHYLRKGKYSGCTPNRVNYTCLETDIIHYLREVATEFVKYYDIRNLVEDSVYTYNIDLTKMEKELEEVKSSIKKKEKAIAEIYDDKLNKIITTDTFKNLSEKHEEELNKFKQKRNDLEGKLNVFCDRSREKEFTKCRKLVEEFLKLENPSRDLMKNLISKIVIYDNGDSKDIKVFFKFKELIRVTNKLNL